MHYKFNTLLLILCLLVSSLQAGVKIITKSQSLGCNEHSSGGQTTMYLRPDIMRIDMQDKESNIGIVFKKSEGKMWILNHTEKKYQSITKEDLEKINEKMNEMREVMDEQLKNLPEEQREQVKKALMQNNASIYEEKPEMAYVKKEDKQVINSWNCVRYDYMEAKKLEGVYWVADFDQVKVKKEDFQITRDFSDFIREHFDLFSFGGSSTMVAPEQNFDGFPVKTTLMEDGKECLVTTVESVREEALDNKLFQIPDGYRREENPMKGR